ncbi:hypothetical protein AURDEDRAFT_188622 [Auricularia subglabra TFB-10046 SS5]|nr:hypothetical protein AURDEDRAFT_188622 [Auricularia subglabra TFB-10046 SS5]
MECDVPSDLERLNVFLSRAGQVPADLRIRSSFPTIDSAFNTVMLPHVHRTRLLQWYSDLDGAALRNARVLQCLLVHGTLTIPEDFLRERVVGLRCLRFTRGSLPRCCPSLSTLAALDVREVEYPSYAASFCGLFDLCPRLQFLSLGRLQAVHADMLPPGPAPPSLRTLFLATEDEDYDLVPHYLAWNTGNLQHVMLDMAGTRRVHPIPPEFLDGAVALSITMCIERTCGRWVAADLPDGGRHALGACGQDTSHIAAFVANVQHSLVHVHTVKISLDAVDPFSDVLAHLPALRHLTIYVDWIAAYNRRELQEPELGALRSLVWVSNALPRLESLVLQVRVSLSRSGCVVSKTDVHNLLAFLESLGPLSLPEMVIQGFSQEVLQGLDQRYLDRLRVRFDTERLQQRDVRMDRSNVYRYWPYGYDY